MELDIIDILKEGLSKTFSRNGLIFIAAAYLLSVFSAVGSQSLITGLSNQIVGQTSMPASPLAIGGPPAIWGIAILFSWVATAWLSVGIIRNFKSDITSSIQKKFFTRKIHIILPNFMIAGTLYGALMVIGGIIVFLPSFLLIQVIPISLLLLIGLVYVLIGLIFWNIYVAAEDQNFIEGMQNSWDLASGNRLELFLLGIAVAVVGLMAGFVTQQPSNVIGRASIVGALISLIGGSFGTVFTVAALVETYNQLR